MRNAVALALFAVGYPVAVVVIVRWLPVVRERRVSWFAAHEAAVSAIVVGQALRMRARGVIINGAWLVIAALWWVLRPGSARRRDRRP